MSAISFRSAVATGLVAKPVARDVKARAGLKVYARMTKDRVSLKKDSKWRSDIDIYPVRPRRRPSRLPLSRRARRRRARAPRAGAALAPAAAPPPARERRETAAQKAPNRNGGWRREGDRVAARFFPERGSRVRERSRALSFRFLVGERKPKSRRRKLTETKNA
jgi:hypothetical protein